MLRCRISSVSMQSHFVCSFQLNEYPLTMQGELFTGIYLGSNTITGSMALEKKIDRLIDGYSGDTGDLTDYIKKNFKEADTDTDDASSETDSVISKEEELTRHRKKKSVSDHGNKPFPLNRSGTDRDYIMKEISLNSSILATSLTDEPASQSTDDNCCSKEQNSALDNVLKKLGKFCIYSGLIIFRASNSVLFLISRGNTSTRNLC